MHFLSPKLFITHCLYLQNALKCHDKMVKKKKILGLLEKGMPAVYREMLAESWEEWGERGNAKRPSRAGLV